MATYLQIQNRVLRNVIDTPSGITDAVATKINDAHRVIQELHNFAVMEAVSSTFTTTANTSEIGSVPSDWKEWHTEHQPYVLRNNGSVRELFVVGHQGPIIDKYTFASTSDTGEAKHILIGRPTDDEGSASFEVWPYPDENSDWDDDDYRVVVPYWKYLPDYSGDADSDWFSTNAPEYLEFKATAEIFAIDWDEERAAFWEQKAQPKLQAAINRDKRARMAQTDTLIYRTGSQGKRMRGSNGQSTI